MTRFYPLESSVLHSPAWFVPFDEFAQRARSADVTTELARFDPAANAWEVQETPAIRTPSAVIAYPELGRRRGPGAQPERFRVRFSAIGFAPLYPADGEDFDASLTGVEFTAYPYDDDTPPAVAGEPRVVRLLPSVAFPYGPGVRTVYGVVRANGVPVANALVEAHGVTSRDGAPWQERTLTSAAGAFRLPLRWEGEPVTGLPEQVFHLSATERPGRTGALDVRLPSGRNTKHVIEIVEQ
ncbi:carboxypeptidase regulatory-like domain-containing protein [Amycolatopsis sp. SID8362]|uniref:carboxypeptidase regulatory-like domain-containing protein n=1 Tax=Amycolatopsis sp. SID8362 TaxID=2690346 RepID=UPI001368AC51|nr:carboxypeptidase regulatory-like domain-containing protein [Amycolatopsis sp. SID8362]NBH11730.1 carboxypeptidase regulatory-like domain-containing protein [Amycolatopsis sp. SID8362]NED48422.1 carboxypeptidase regulatory-like domain-containing protein [Amycolatopsis sp. SID8362]